jgi:hypothetical protein
MISLEVTHILPVPVGAGRGGGSVGSGAVGEGSTGTLVAGRVVGVGATAVRVGAICVLVGWMIASSVVNTSSGAGLPSLEARLSLTLLSIAKTKL